MHAPIVILDRNGDPFEYYPSHGEEPPPNEGGNRANSGAFAVYALTTESWKKFKKSSLKKELPKASPELVAEASHIFGWAHEH